MRSSDDKRINFASFMLVGIIAFICSVIVCLFALAYVNLKNIYFVLFISSLPIISVVIFLIGAIGTDIENKKEEGKIRQNKYIFQREYDEYIKKLQIVERDTQVTLLELNDRGFYSSIQQYIWLEDNCLYMFPMAKYYIENCTSSTVKPTISKLQLISIPVNKIEYFEEIGELRKYITVSGGGFSLKGAVIGKIIAGDAGAVIASRVPIKSEVVSEDDRRIELIYKNEQNEILNLEFEYDAYDVLKNLIPSKELRRIMGLNSSIGAKENLDNQQSMSVKQKLEQLSDLKAEGLISEEEFLEQKKKILDSF